MTAGLVVDLFAGGGGASVGIEAALGRPVDLAINHSATALAVHAANHPRTVHLTADIYEVDPLQATGGRPVDLLWASPDCTHFSIAKGNVPRSQKIRTLAWTVVKWARAVAPLVICLENVQEFRGWGPLSKDGRPDKARMGETFARWKRALERLGYVVDHRILDASLYGAPTRRRRLFLVARRDGLPITWPKATHGPGLLPIRTAAECIDWSLPCPSIFERRKPLAEKTLWRIAQGIRRFVLENPRPFIVRYQGQRREGELGRVEDLEDALPTQTTENRFGLVVPSVVKFRHDSTGSAVDEPMPTVTAGGKERPARPATGNPLGLIAPSLIKVNHGKAEARGEDIAAPLSTVTATQRGHALVAPTLMQTGYGEREGQAARNLDLFEPLGTVVAGGQKHALVSAFLAKHFGGVVGQELTEPASTITATDHHALVTAAMVTIDHGSSHQGTTSTEAPLPTTTTENRHAVMTAALVEPGQRHGRGDASAEAPLSTVMAKDRHALAAVALAKFRGTHESQPASLPVTEPLPTTSAGGIHVAEVRAFLTTYYGQDTTGGQTLFDPARTITAKHRLGLVTVEGTEYQIVDIGMRMLEPHELLRAQFGRFAETYDLTAAKTKSAKVRLIGNSVCPEVAEALVRAQFPEEMAMEGAA